MKNVDTHQLIPDFPATRAAITYLNSVQVDNILVALGQQVQGSLIERKEKLCFFIGLSLDCRRSL